MTRRDRPELGVRKGVQAVAWVPGTERKAVQVAAVHAVDGGLGRHVLLSPWARTRRGGWFPMRRGVRVPVHAISELIDALRAAEALLEKDAPVVEDASR